MTRISLSKNGNTPFEKIIGHNTEILTKWCDLEETLWQNSSLNKNLLEQIRRAMAFEAGCEYCMVKSGRPDFNESEIKISVAISFAELFCKDHHSILDGHFSLLKEYFSEKEILELCTFISFVNASQKLGKVFHLTEDFQKNAVVKLKDL
ncbi:carboxymuconolactone decarboxylase family protein [Chryseobacterium sp. C39-AII1]|uniref:carboxymuconolactone decarboxylase family protein n=1 Tax=Chryseobacterium sp. C39-AII1 TaxID=3080332 RepID=UPI00320A1B5A